MKTIQTPLTDPRNPEKRFYDIPAALRRHPLTPRVRIGAAFCAPQRCDPAVFIYKKKPMASAARQWVRFGAGVFALVAFFAAAYLFFGA